MKIKNTFAPDSDMTEFDIRDLAYGIKFGALTWKMIPEEYHDEVQAYLDSLPETE